MGRFLQPDAIIQDVTDPQALNRYAYGRNNPVKYVDSDGHLFFIPALIVGAVITMKAIDYGWTAYDAWQAGRTLADPNASSAAKAQAASDLAMTAAFELAEPDDFLPIALPLDDLARRGFKGSQLPMSGLAGTQARQGAHFIKGIDTTVNGERVRRISGQITDPSLKGALREEARAIYDVVNPGRRKAEALDLHHRVPLEWSHLFPDADPNRLSNLVGLHEPLHNAITGRWNSWRASLGRSPSEAEVMKFARQIDDEFSAYFR